MDYQAKVTRVVDGDSLDVAVMLGLGAWLDARVRVRYVDTPETRTRDRKEKAAGLLAKERVVGLLPPGTQVTLKDVGKEKFGRLLACVIAGGASLSDILISEHLAVPYHGQSKEAVKAAHIQNRKILRQEGKL